MLRCDIASFHLLEREVFLQSSADVSPSRISHAVQRWAELAHIREPLVISEQMEVDIFVPLLLPV